MLGHLGSQPRPRGCPGWSWGEQVSCRCCDSTAHPVLLILGSFLGLLGELFSEAKRVFGPIWVRTAPLTTLSSLRRRAGSRVPCPGEHDVGPER